MSDGERDGSDPEPGRNISGGTSGGGSVTAFDSGGADTRAEAVVDRLGERYWQKTYGDQAAFECLVRTILSQNTSDAASQPAHDSLLDRYGGDGDLAATLADADQQTLAGTIRPAGLYNRKSAKITGAAQWVCEAYGGASGFDDFVKRGDPGEVRDTLLSVDGVGPKTADCVLLFAGGRGGVFPVDTHVHRIARRTGLAPADADHETVRTALEDAVPARKCGFGHTAMIQFGRDTCSARTPACLDDPDACPMADICDQVGIDTVGGTVVDPGETAD